MNSILFMQEAGCHAVGSGAILFPPRGQSGSGQHLGRKVARLAQTPAIIQNNNNNVIVYRGGVFGPQRMGFNLL